MLVSSISVLQIHILDIMDCISLFSFFVVIPYLLIYITSPLETIRRGSVQALRAILGVHRSSSTYRLFKKLTKNEDEIASDAAYAPMVS